MSSPRTVLTASTLILALFASASSLPGAEWAALLTHPPAGANMVVLVNSDALRLGAAKLKNAKDGAQKEAAANILAEIPEHTRRAAIAAFVDFDSLEPVWQSTTATFEKGKVPTAKAIADHEGGYLDQVAGKTVVWSPRGRYIIPHGADRLAVYKPADRPGAARWMRGLTKPAQPLPDYLKKTVDRTLDGAALVLAVDMVDSISPVSAKTKLGSLPSLANAKAELDALSQLIGDLHGVTFTVSVEDQFMGELRFDFGSAAGPLNKAGKDLVVEAFSRRGLLLPELREWKGGVHGKSYVLDGPLDASSVINLLAFLTGSPSTDDAAYHGGASTAESTTSAGTTQAQASKRYFTSVQRILSECRDTKGLSVAQRGVFNDKLSRKIDQLPLLHVDKDLLDYGANIAQLIRGAGAAIRTANVAAGGQKAVAATSSTWYGYGGGFSFNDNSEYNSSLERQAHAQGMQQHVTNMEQVDNLTAEIRRSMTDKYQIEF
ncbi:MAG: hypothetical protein HY290_22960 [Planctomycetia bacterium]|nr:hypothetical protein [Planctomycetia bacterium]